jgi:hypothetical protein
MEKWPIGVFASVDGKKWGKKWEKMGTFYFFGGKNGDILLFCSRTAARAETRFEAELFGSAPGPAGTAERRATLHALPQRGQFCFGLRFVNQHGPVVWSCHWAGGQDRVADACHTLPQARPGPSVGSSRQLGPQRIALDIPQDCQIVVVFLDRKRLEPPLPDVAAASVMPVVTPDVGGHQPLHPATEIAIAVGTQDQVKMVRH